MPTHKCKHPGCDADCLTYIGKYGIRHQKYCREHHNEANKRYASTRKTICKVCGKSGTKAEIVRGRCPDCKNKKMNYKKSEKDFLEMAKNYNRENPTIIDRDILGRAFNDIARIPSGGKCNHANIEGE